MTAFVLGAALALGACRTAEPAPTTGGPEPGAAQPQTLPELELRADTPNVLLTWVGEDGDFHVTESIAEVPEGRRERVRVVRTDEVAGTGATVYVANLSAPASDGTFAVATMTRADWEALGADLRKTRMEAFSPDAQEKPPADGGGEAASEVSAIIYGADWCKPCHDAEHYLESLGVKVTKKNIEKSRAAQAEMRQKLASIHRDGAGIPVIDLMGQIFIGYSKPSLKQAVAAARARSGQSG